MGWNVGQAWGASPFWAFRSERLSRSVFVKSTVPHSTAQHTKDGNASPTCLYTGEKVSRKMRASGVTQRGLQRAGCRGGGPAAGDQQVGRQARRQRDSSDPLVSHEQGHAAGALLAHLLWWSGLSCSREKSWNCSSPPPSRKPSSSSLKNSSSKSRSCGKAIRIPSNQGGVAQHQHTAPGRRMLAASGWQRAQPASFAPGMSVPPRHQDQPAGGAAPANTWGSSGRVEVMTAAAAAAAAAAPPPPPPAGAMAGGNRSTTRLSKQGLDQAPS